MAAPYSGEYEVPWLAELLHSFPHLDLTFQFTNNSFSPEFPRYREALLFWGAIPVLWLLMTLLLFLMYFCYRCCQKDASKKRHGSCLPWAMAILALLTGGVIGVGFYGNEEQHKGFEEILSGGRDADITLSQINTKALALENVVQHDLLQNLQQLFQIFESARVTVSDPSKLEKFKRDSLENAREIVPLVSGIDRKPKTIQLNDYLDILREYSYYGWVGSIVMLCWQVLLVLLLLFGIGKSSKCTLLMFCAFGIFTLVHCWVTAGALLATLVGLGDFCMSPDVYLEKYNNERIDRELLRYYIQCDNEVVNPFGMSLKLPLDHVTATNRSMHKAIHLVDQNAEHHYMSILTEVDTALNKAVHILHQMTTLVTCDNIHRDYQHAVHGLCHSALTGSVFMLLWLAAAGLMLTTLVLLASCAWRHFGPRKGYREVDEDETFLPRNDNASPSYYSFPRGRHSNPREHVPMHRRSSPPPAVSIADDDASWCHKANPTAPNPPHYRQVKRSDAEITHTCTYTTSK